jgi:tetratricopeptide (TPR) repeat protein
MPRFLLLLTLATVMEAGHSVSTITIDYPEPGSIFPPEITPPTFLWHDRTTGIPRWRIDIRFADGSTEIHATSRGEHLPIGPIDPDCVTDTNQPPKLSPQLAEAHSWRPDAATWAIVKKHSVASPAIVTISGPDSRGSVEIRTSSDPAGVPIFYRDVPLMPSEPEPGVIKPLAAIAVPLVAWRLRDLSAPASRVVMEGLPVCANCHSFSADGKTLGMDMDGLKNNRGLYILTRVAPETRVSRENLLQWSTAKGALKGQMRRSFMSQVSPDGRYVVTTIDPLQLSGKGEPPSNYYVANFKDYRFLQVFYPTRGILAWYSQSTGILQPLPGADDPRYVQMGGVWSRDGQYLVFARAAARDPNPPGAPLAQFANDPHEVPLQYDLYRIPFRGGQGGKPEPVVGASSNGMSNSFPKISPDGRWIVFVKARNGLLMRPDSQLYIVPASGGEARRMHCNTTLMNSWHSFSPNGRWLVFSSKNRSPYTQMYLTHIDQQGNDSPAILIDNATASNRAVNIPEFVNIEPGALESIGGPALDFYRLVNKATYWQKNGRPGEAVTVWRQALAIDPEDPTSHDGLARSLLLAGRMEEAAAETRKGAELQWRAVLADRPGDATARRNLGVVLMESGQLEEAAAQLAQAVALDPASAAAHCNLGIALMKQGKIGDALAEQHRALALDARYAPAYYNLGLLRELQGDTAEAVRQWEEALQIRPRYEEAHDRLAAALDSQGKVADALAHWREGTNDLTSLRRQAWILATDPDAAIRNGEQAEALAVRAVEVSHGKDPAAWDTLAAAYAQNGRFADAAQTAKRALTLAQPDLAEAIRKRIQLYEMERPFREK